jgi:hypothetical protein
LLTISINKLWRKIGSVDHFDWQSIMDVVFAISTDKL